MSTVERHPDDLPPPEGLPRDPGGSGFPTGVMWAVVLGLVTLGIALWAVWGSGGDDEAAQLDDRTVMPADDDPETGAAPGSPMPDVEFATFDGATRSLDEFAGKPLVVNFWASTCIPCITEMPDIDALHDEMGDSVTFLGINTAEGTNPAERFLEQVPVGYELGRDPDGSAIMAFGKANLPTTVIIDADGMIRETHTGIISKDDLRSKIEAVL